MTDLLEANIIILKGTQIFSELLKQRTFIVVCLKYSLLTYSIFLQEGEIQMWSLFWEMAFDKHLDGI